MAELSNTIGAGLAAYYESTAAALHKWVDPLSQEQFWRNPFKYGNSAGHLVLHVTGNLKYYIGTEIAGTGYVRHREREFTEAEKLPKEHVLQEFDQTMAMVATTARKQSAEDWQRAYKAMGEEDAGNRFNTFLRCAAHAYHHVGQIIYLCRELAQQDAPPRR
jgi:uncharacterized damage-inducible protein DinB